MAGLIKRWLKSETAQRLACRLAAAYIRLAHATGRFDVIGAGPANARWDAGQPFILAFWHGRLLMMPYVWRAGVPMNMLISQHRDGRLIADTIAHFGLGSIAGSSSKGGAAALRQMVKAIRAGQYAGVTPDGPRGPRQRASGGIASIAKLSGVPVIPAAVGVRRRRLLGTWDRFMVPMPFSRGVFIWGEPIHVARDADAAALDRARQAIEDELNRITAEADRVTGHEPLPLPPPPSAPAAAAASPDAAP
ncbi:lysophospholipid acyltransferase family protein [Tistrella bauzanensis]|uniref:Lysophospholipid acyltransferase family protein n=1 Tax=Tistrella arctica TaxID=3133430 RepID=A0ABU9YJB6_9PROT